MATPQRRLNIPISTATLGNILLASLGPEERTLQPNRNRKKNAAKHNTAMILYFGFARGDLNFTS